MSKVLDSHHITTKTVISQYTHLHDTYNKS
ncbi:hypothetical protein IMAU10142_01828 [Lactobacillus helveticus]|jgi:hypothetical protein|uniref:Uncharacterized protein n=1 Tax=Lactobacillus helveticus TaxID=1587 RepID=A0A9Q5C9L5_LACHE|nr:hypothetical protein [Lactobacillus helveticus]NRN74639.1 hypothetical protein [Lactobacillus helveticus]NRN77998.1 hypothetical protein [Lactobacillus helveticus]NRN81167.1 hypothetical protein [Lactobacillus helveticus]NRN82214.1 hypothetical protein [Lactobacillus helveticus]